MVVQEYLEYRATYIDSQVRFMIAENQEDPEQLEEQLGAKELPDQVRTKKKIKKAFSDINIVMKNDRKWKRARKFTNMKYFASGCFN